MPVFRHDAGKAERLRPAVTFLSVFVTLLFALAVSSGLAGAQGDLDRAAADGQTPSIDSPEVAETVEVQPTAADEDIAGRLRRILRATNWYQDPVVEVDEGVVFLSGRVDNEQHKEWAGKLAANTSDVVAVVNRLEVVQGSMWDLSPTWRELQELAAALYRSLPLLVVGLAMLIATWLLAGWSVKLAKALFRRRLQNNLLRQVAAQAVAIPVFLIGLYLILRVSGLTRLAMTVLGGTGLVGLIIGFAFRDIAENFLASILISIQHPFAQGDLIAVAGHTGYVQRVNMRSTLLMTMEGNHLQIPNATIYKETIINYTSNPNLRLQFTIGIGNEESISKAQSTAYAVLRDHPAVVDEPESLVLVDSLGAATVKLSILFWIDSQTFSQFKVKSAVIRLTKQAFDKAGISMPDEAREIVFPEGVPVSMISSEETARPVPAEPPREDEVAVHKAEGNLESEASEIRNQADRARVPEGGQNLL